MGPRTDMSLFPSFQLPETQWWDDGIPGAVSLPDPHLHLSTLWHGHLEERRLWGDLIAPFQLIKWAYRKDRERLFTRACGGRTRGNNSKLERGQIWTGNKEEIFHHEKCAVAQVA